MVSEIWGAERYLTNIPFAQEALEQLVMMSIIDKMKYFYNTLLKQEQMFAIL